MSWYIDASAFVKFFIAEAESAALVNFVRPRRGALELCSSRMLVTEAGRVGVVAGVPDDEVDVHLGRISLILPSSATFETARRIGPPHLRSLDALHLATALELGVDLEGLIAYDKRLLDAAVAAGVPTKSPGIG